MNAYPDVEFIFRVRYGRDVVYSENNIPHRKQHVFFLADKWKWEQIKSLNVYRELEGCQQALMVKYEDLIRQTDREIQRVCDFVGVEFEQDMVHFCKSKDAKEDAGKKLFWRNLTKPVMKDNSNKYKKELNDRDILIFEQVCGTLLMALGYSVTNGPPYRNFSYRRKTIYTIKNIVMKFFIKNKNKLSGRHQRGNQRIKKIKEKRMNLSK